MYSQYILGQREARILANKSLSQWTGLLTSLMDSRSLVLSKAAAPLAVVYRAIIFARYTRQLGGSTSNRIRTIICSVVALAVASLAVIVAVNVTRD
ncbi:hypothetical protein J6590_052273 [Homalodisca vitripennis]|nr:hypothetical protein J6590_052273 [Homalodisca vitripennis]